MNAKEFKCVNILTDLIENEGLVGIKTSFEDEGASFNETIRLKEICNQAKTKLTIKIGGPEAIRDIKDVMTIGVKGIVAPMVESPFGLKKFIDAATTHICPTALSSIQLNINIETVDAYQSHRAMLKSPAARKLYGVTVGRVDLVSSMGKDRSYVNSEEVYMMVETIFCAAKEDGLKLCLGGAVSLDSLEFLQKLSSNKLLDKFETRYAIYDASVALKNLSRALFKGQIFEYEWLKCKQEHYRSLADQDNVRIDMIQARINQCVEGIN